MRSASLAEIRKELRVLSKEEVLEFTERLIRYKRENKELLNYLLFESMDEDAYAQRIKEEVSEAFSATNTSGFYLAKKSIRRALRIANKYIKYSEKPETELDVLLHFCEEMNRLNMNFKSSKVLLNLYERQVVKIKDVYTDMHEDLQFDFKSRVEAL